MDLKKCLPGMLAMAVGAAVSAHASLILPSWTGEPTALSQSFTFTTSANPAAPESFTNPHGSGSATVTLGPFGDGWFPETSVLARDGTSGAWDLGQAGTIEVLMPFRTGGGVAGVLEVFVHVIAMQSVTALPDIQVAGSHLGFTITDSENVRNGPDVWYDRTWSGFATVLDGDALRVTVAANPDSGSFVDQVSVYVIPEPTVLSILMVSMAVFASRMRRVCR
jgi:hypothetical protein